VSGLLAALWLLGLFAAAPALRTSASYEIADRLRDALILGVAIPFALGFVHLLYPIACWCTLAVCIAVAYARRSAGARPTEGAMDPPYVLIAALVAVGWPHLMRPMLDGDSLSYHLPNAAAWVQAHSLWTTATRYWWYPPASELFASGLYAVGSPFALPWCGFGALILLGLRVVAWARDAYGAAPILADALGAATVTAYPLAFQAGTLQNDVWLAAFWLEMLWALRAMESRTTALRTVAVTALIKPHGWLMAAIALLAYRAPARLWLAAIGAIGVWLAHDALLWKGAIVAPSSATYGIVWSSTILAHGAPALALLDRVALATSPFAFVAFCAALLGPAIARNDRALSWAAFGAALLFFVLPFGYSTSVAQLATGASLRFAAPAVAAGAVLLAILANRVTAIATPLLLASTIFGVGSVLAIFWNDAPTRAAPGVALVAIAAVWLARVLRRAWPIAAGLIAIGIAGEFLAGSHPVDFYADALRVDGRSTRFYAWIQASHPTAIGGWGLALGAVNVLAPQTRTVEIPDVGACAFARTQHLLLAAIAENDRTPQFNAARLREARECGAVRYDDGISVVVSPTGVR
jgi:hypothetical protein